jgi:hypothetical protein
MIANLTLTSHANDLNNRDLVSVSQPKSCQVQICCPTPENSRIGNFDKPASTTGL